MAFSFFDDIGGLVKAGAGIASLFTERNAKKEIPALRSLEEGARLALEYAKASADPNSAQFKNIAALEEEANRSSSVQAIERMMRLNRRARARGDVGFGINPERRDETRAAALARSFMDAREKSRIQAREILRGAAASASGAAQGYQPVANIQASFGQENQERLAGGIEAVGDLLSTIQRGFPGQLSRPSESFATTRARERATRPLGFFSNVYG